SKKNYDPRDNGGKEFDLKKCVDSLTEANKKKDAKNFDISKGVRKLDVTDWATKRISFGAKNGNDYFQVYGFVKANAGIIKREDRGVILPSWGKARTPTERDITLQLEGLGFAQAEFYFDDPDDWDSVTENGARLGMKWRARLRRFRFPSAVSPNVVLNGIPAW